MKRFASVFSRDYRYYDTSLYLKVENSDFFARGRKVKDLGWKINYHTEKDKILPELSINEVGITETLKVIDKKTTAPSQYTDSSILQDMVNPSRMVENVKLKKIYRGDIGIGTQSTRAAIIETLITRKYLIREKKNLVITHKGILLIENFNKMKISSKLIMPEETAQWESSLEDIALGRGDGRKFINDIIKFTRSGVEEWNDFNIEKVLIQRNDKTKGSSLGTCPLCKSSIVENKKAYGCQNWKLGCKFTVWKKISGKSISKVQIKKILRTGKSDNLKGFRSKSGKKFNALLVLEEGKIKFSFSRS